MDIGNARNDFLSVSKIYYMISDWLVNLLYSQSVASPRFICT